jgi:hypothetical protein
MVRAGRDGARTMHMMRWGFLPPNRGTRPLSRGRLNGE